MQTAYPSATWQWHLAQVVEPVGYAVAGMRPTYNARAVAPAMYARCAPGVCAVLVASCRTLSGPMILS